MTKTLILLFHPDLSQSTANAALARSAAQVPGVEVVDMQATCPGIDRDRDGAAEAARLLVDAVRGHLPGRGRGVSGSSGHYPTARSW